MNSSRFITLVALASASMVVTGCTNAPKSPDVTGNVRRSLDQAGVKNVSVSQDRDKGVVTLTGNVASDADKAQAESLAKSGAAGQVIADEIAVIPPGGNDVKTVNSDMDSAISKNLDAALIEHHLNKGVHYTVKNGVVTLTGDANSEASTVEPWDVTEVAADAGVRAVRISWPREIEVDGLIWRKTYGLVLVDVSWTLRSSCHPPRFPLLPTSPRWASTIMGTIQH